MPAPRRPGSIHLFRLFAVDVYLHWTWLLAAAYELYNPPAKYSSKIWNVAEYLTLFVIVLLHEFGHALACRSVGGEANRIMLWPLGGVAFVNPPPRPGAHLWSIAAGPLVNVALIPVTLCAMLLVGLPFTTATDLQKFIFMVTVINIGLLLFNMLPIYPLDGGQIVRSILWFFIGPARSLMVASIVGLVGGAAAVIFALFIGYPMLVLLALFSAFQSFAAFQHSRKLGRMLALPRHDDVHCPGCNNSPPAAPLWRCACGASFDTFATNAACPNCGRSFQETSCPHCHQRFPFHLWRTSTDVASAAPVQPVTAPPLDANQY